MFDYLHNDFNSMTYLQGSPDTTIFVHPGNHTVAKIVLSGDLLDLILKWQCISSSDSYDVQSLATLGNF